MINGVLTERTVSQVVPILQTNSDGLRKTLEELVKQYKGKQDEMEKWKVCFSLYPDLSPSPSLLSFSVSFLGCLERPGKGGECCRMDGNG